MFLTILLDEVDIKCKRLSTLILTKIGGGLFYVTRHIGTEIGRANEETHQTNTT